MCRSGTLCKQAASDRRPQGWVSNQFSPLLDFVDEVPARRASFRLGVLLKLGKHMWLASEAFQDLVDVIYIYI